MPKALITSVIRVACPVWSKPPPSLGVRPKLAQKRTWSHLRLFCASASDQTSETCILAGEMSRSDRGVRGLTESRSSHRKRPWNIPRPLSVRAKGLEPIRTKAPDPKSGLATNYNTLAKPFGRLITLSPSLKPAFWKLPTSVSERITKLCIFFKNPKQPASGHYQKQSLT